MNQAAQTARRLPEFAADYAAIAKRREKKIAAITVARKLLTRAWHLLSEMQPRRPAAVVEGAGAAGHEIQLT